MAAFRFTLQAALNYREHVLELRRGMLAAVQAQINKVAEERSGVERFRERQIDELRGFVTTGAVEIDRAAARRYHAAVLTGELFRLDRHRDLLEQQREAVRRAVVKADQDVKVLEKLREKQKQDWTAKTIAREDREREDQWQAAHRTAS
jgi:hypothetical protein